MRIVVHIPDWVMESGHAAVEVAGLLSGWLVMKEAERFSAPSEAVQRIQGHATPLADWPGGELGRRPVRVDVGAAALYWDAPSPVTGPVDLEAMVQYNTADAPEGFPETEGVVRRLRMEWKTFVMKDDFVSRAVDGSARYDDVPLSFIPLQPFQGQNRAAYTSWTGLLADVEIEG